LDTAKNIIDYIQIIHKALKPGGLLINAGPLLYHFEGDNSGDGVSIELTLEEVKLVLGRCGFVLEHEEWMNSGYVQNRASMLHTTYQCHCSVWRRTC
jgi:carnosine N-methyltransferase